MGTLVGLEVITTVRVERSIDLDFTDQMRTVSRVTTLYGPFSSQSSPIAHGRSHYCVFLSLPIRCHSSHKGLLDTGGHIKIDGDYRTQSEDMQSLSQSRLTLSGNQGAYLNSDRF